MRLRDKLLAARIMRVISLTLLAGLMMLTSLGGRGRRRPGPGWF